MKIVDAYCSKGMTGFFFDDQAAIKTGAEHDGAAYFGQPITPGFSSIRQPGESLSIILVLDDGRTAVGDCAAVQYSGAGGRDPLFRALIYEDIIKKHIFPRLIGRDMTHFREISEEIDSLMNPETGKLFHTAIRYGISQAILDASAKSNRLIMAEIISREYGTFVSNEEIPIFTQTGDDRYTNADKMIIKRAGVLPHGLINNVPEKLGNKGELLEEYIVWLSERVDKLGGSSYSPVLHIDVYGTIGMIFDNDFEKMVEYFTRLKKASGRLDLRIEGPLDTGRRESQAMALAKLTDMVNRRVDGFEIVADEWCNTLCDIKYFADMNAGHMIQIKTPDLGGINNTVDAVLYCREKGMGAYQGGTCNETDISARACVHVAMATSPDMILAKPGMGVDEGYMIVYNEMQRILAARRRKA
jgi:methylaspartate ammonia-lyase